MADSIPGFFAYPSSPASSGDSIRAAVKALNRGKVVSIKTWEECRVGGKLIISEICKEIENCEIFCADLTGINPNVLFELAYAIAFDKRIWLTLDSSYPDRKAQFNRLRFLTTVGYAEFNNSRDIEEKFYSDQPYDDSVSTLYSQMIAPSLEVAASDRLLYLKSLVDSEASVQISGRVAASTIPQTVDDPTEVAVQSLTWYGVNTSGARGVLCHLLSPDRTDYLLNNARNAFVAGLACGMNKPLLILAEGDLLGPLDYRDIARQYSTSEQAVKHLNKWIGRLEKEWLNDARSREGFQTKQRLATELKTFQLGEPFAENESEGLIDHYFIETTAFREAVEGKHSIFVGRKGVGKSANFLKLAATVGTNPNNLVCEIKPISYQLQSITELVGGMTQVAAKGYALESMWKFLIYSEIANSLTREIEEYRSDADEEDQESLIKLMDRDGGMLREEFSVRLERCVNSLANSQERISENHNQEERVGIISQALHEGILRDLRLLLGRLLKDRKKVFVLIDNLDKSWDKKNDLDGLSQFFLGLLGAIKRIEHDFRRDHSRLEAINLTVAVFLRSDIFFKIRSIAREPDKLDHFRLDWNDPELLLRLIEERFVSLHDGGVSPLEIWRKYFVSKVGGTAIKRYLVKQVLPRPRDLIVLVKAAISTAVNRGHPRVEESDIREAEKLYSQFAVDSGDRYSRTAKDPGTADLPRVLLDLGAC